MPRPVPKTPSRRAPPASKRRRPKARRSPRPSHATRKQRLTRAAKAAIATTGVIVTGAIAAGAVHQHRSRRVRQLLREQADFGIPKRARSPSGWRSVVRILDNISLLNHVHLRELLVQQNDRLKDASRQINKLTKPSDDEARAQVRAYVLQQTYLNYEEADDIDSFIRYVKFRFNEKPPEGVNDWLMALGKLSEDIRENPRLLRPAPCR